MAERGGIRFENMQGETVYPERGGSIEYGVWFATAPWYRPIKRRRLRARAGWNLGRMFGGMDDIES